MGLFDTIAGYFRGNATGPSSPPEPPARTMAGWDAGKAIEMRHIPLAVATAPPGTYVELFDLARDREVIPRETVEETPWQPLRAGGETVVNIRHAIDRDEAGYWVRRENDEDWELDPPVGPFAELRDARHEAETDFEDLQASWEARQVQNQAQALSHDGIETVWSSGWGVDSPGFEVREHIGQSDKGWHYAVETSRFGGDDHADALPWSPAYPSREQAEASLQTATLHLGMDRDDEGHER